MYSQAMSFLNGNKHEISNQGIDEQQMVGAHQQLYGQGGVGGGQQHSADTLGAGAAMQALKMFTGGSGGGGGVGGGQGGQGGQSEFVGMAMAQAGKLFDQQNGQGNVVSPHDRECKVFDKMADEVGNSKETSNLPSPRLPRWPFRCMSMAEAKGAVVLLVS